MRIGLFWEENAVLELKYPPDMVPPGAKGGLGGQTKDIRALLDRD